MGNLFTSTKANTMDISNLTHIQSINDVWAHLYSGVYDELYKPSYIKCKHTRFILEYKHYYENYVNFHSNEHTDDDVYSPVMIPYCDFSDKFNFYILVKQFSKKTREANKLLVDNPFYGGEYIFHLKFTSDFPFKAPEFHAITKSGVFKTTAKICVNGISDYHQTSWNPATIIYTVFVSLIHFMMEMHIISPDARHGISIEYKPDEIQPLALISAETNQSTHKHLMDMFAQTEILFEALRLNTLSSQSESLIK